MNGRVKLLIAGAAGLAIGGAVGYSVAYKRLEQLFANRLDDEIAFAKEFYSGIHKLGDLETPEKAVEKLIPEEEAAALRARQVLETYRRGTPEDMDRLKDSRIKGPYHPDIPPARAFDAKPTPTDLGEMRPAFDATKPYRIGAGDFAGGDEYPQFTYTWYKGDEVLAGEEDEKIENVDQVVGVWNMTQFGVDTADAKTLYIRNELRREEYEIVLSEGRYDVEVLGHTFDPPEQQE